MVNRLLTPVCRRVRPEDGAGKDQAGPARMPGHHGLAERADRLLTTRILKSYIGTYSHIKRDQLFKIVQVKLRIWFSCH